MLVDEIKFRSVRILIFNLFRNNLAYKVYKKTGHREDYDNGNQVENGMEHSQLGLRRIREHPVEDVSKTEVST